MPLRMLRYVRPDENWTRTATMSATSAETRFEAARAQNQKPAWPWWATSGTATLTATLTGSLEVGIVGIIHSNRDHGGAMTIGGGLAGSVNGARQANSYPKNVAYIPSSPVSASSVTVAASGNSINFSIGELVVGKLREFPISLSRGARRFRRRDQFSDVAENVEYETRIDLGSERWRASGQMFAFDATLAEFEAWWESTNGGTIPTLIIPNDFDNEPRFCFMQAEISWSNDGGNQHLIDVEFIEAPRGILVY